MGLSPKLQEIVKSLERDRLALLRATEELNAAQADYRPSEDAWSVSDVLHHLALSEEASAKLMSLMSKRVHEESVGPDPDPDGSVLRSLDDVVADADDRKATAPDRVTPLSHVPAAECRARLEASRRNILAKIEELSPFDLTGLTFPHPFFGELDVYQWLLITGWHERRHTRQIQSIKTSSDFPD